MSGFQLTARGAPDFVGFAARWIWRALLSTLLITIADEEHFKQFFARKAKFGAVTSAVPGKDNGLDIEGLAVSEDRIFIGLRGPVLRGWTVILAMPPCGCKHAVVQVAL